MPNLFRKLPNQNIGRITRGLLFFALFYLYLWLQVDMRLIYHGGGVITDFPTFFKGWEFFQSSLSYPGGLVEYLASFLSAFLYHSWSGALIVTLLAWSICTCTDYLLKTINATSLRWLRFLPAILLLISYTRYAYHFTTTLAFLLALFFACLYVRITPKSRPLGLLLLFAFSIILYTIAGGAYLFFALLCAIYELLFRRRLDMALLHSLSALIIPHIIGVLLFNISTTNAFTNSLPFSWKILHYGQLKRMVTVMYILYLFLPITAMVLGSWRILTAKFHENKRYLKHFEAISTLLSWYRRKPLLRWSIESSLLFAIAAGAAYFSYNKKTKTLFEVDYYAYHRMWPQVLSAAERFRNDYFIVHAVNRALYHTGRLAYDVFSYPQNPYTLLLNAKEHRSAHWKKIDLYIDLGHINIAENALTESLENLGPRPVVLKRLALINMVKGNTDSARVYLRTISKTLFHARWANNYLAKLDHDPNLSTDSRIQQLRTLMVEKDYGFNYPEAEQALLTALEKNPHNQMAFEYLMTWYMLTKQLDKFTLNIRRLDDFDYPNIPPTYEQAIILYTISTGKTVDLHGRSLSPELRQQFEGLNKILEQHKTNIEQAFSHAAKEYANSYFLYYSSGRSGIKK